MRWSFYALRIVGVASLIIIVNALGCVGSPESGVGDVMSHYPQEKWLDAGAGVSYRPFTHEVAIQKSRITPAWGGAILEIGDVDLSTPYFLRFQVTALKGLYAVIVHYGGMEYYERQHVKIQNDTSFVGGQEYNLSEALRMEQIYGKQQVAIQILVIDTPSIPAGTAMVRLKELRVGPRQ